MGSIQDLLQEVPLAAVLRERVALADQKYEAAVREVEDLKRKIAALERENAELRTQIPPSDTTSLGDDTNRVLVHLFLATESVERDVGMMAAALGMEKGMLQYHLDRLQEVGFAKVTGGNYVDGHVYWGLTPSGRQHVVGRKLLPSK
jgi:DNA-binding transcriptional ArsR family regulator